ncbi:MAG TPA: MFS transporter [Clostridiales bacterium]|nr:MFS transporter [Clostridiales bacterium]
MKLSHKLIFFISPFCIGITAPVFSLVLLSHGATLESLSICVGIFAATVVLLELPSGILTDLIGRKRTFLISQCFMLCYFLLVLFSRNVLLLAIACAIQGIGRAFSSGSLEALEIEAYMKEKGTEGLSKINSTLAVITSAGLASGSLCGGLFGYLDPTYTLLLAVCILLEAFLLILTLLFVKERWEKTSDATSMIQLKNQVHNLFSSLKRSKIIITILAMSVMLGLGLSTIEVYWQPALKLFLPEHLGWIFGIINCLGYLGMSLGNKGAERIWRHWHLSENVKRPMMCYWPLRLLLPFTILLLGLCGNIPVFIFLFILTYFVLGAGNLFEDTIFHSSIDNSQRASMMSLSSLFLRSGGILTSILGSLILTGFSLPYVWILLSAATGAGILLLMVLYRRR